MYKNTTHTPHPWIAKTNLIDEKMKAKKIFDRKSKEILYEIGEHFLLKHEHRYPGRSKKLDSDYRCPFVITEIISPQNVEIKMKKYILVY